MLMNKSIVRAAIVLLMFFSVVITNRFVGFEEVVMNGFSDVNSYTAIAKAFPHLPKSVAMFHHAQRLFFPYIIGMISYVSGMSLYTSFMVFTIIFLLASLYVIDGILRFYNVSEPLYAVCMALVIFNPYVIRQYLLAPGMITDLMFFFGTAVIISGLIRKSIFMLVSGSIVAILARQTALVFIPGFFVWIFISGNFSDRSLKNKIFNFTVISVIIILLYKITDVFASKFGGLNINLQHIFSTIPYLKYAFAQLHGSAFFYFFINIILRESISLIISIAVLVLAIALCWKDGKLLKQLSLMILFALLIMLQPVMNANPESATRLVSFAIIAIVSAIAQATALKHLTSKTAFFVCLLCFIASGHHYYSSVRFVLPSFANYQFAALHFTTAAIIFIVLWRDSSIRQQRT
jgi:hypothetical protein